MAAVARVGVVTLVTMVMLVGSAGGAGGQSMLDRTPNLSGGWTGAKSTLHFNFLHRFTKSGPPDNQISNNPTFLLGGGIADGLLVGLNYATRSNLVPRFPNEWEFFGRYAPLRQASGAPLEVAIEGAYNHAAESVDGELALARDAGRLRVLGTARFLGNGFGRDTARFALGGGAVVRVNRWLAVAGDAVTLLDRRDGEEVAWGAGVHVAIPLTPHTLSIQVTNTNSGSLQGSSRGDGVVRYGFEFTVPLTLSRYFGRREEAVTLASGDAAAGAATTVQMRRIAFEHARVVIERGGTVTWQNNDQVIHTVRAMDGSWESPEIAPGRTYSRQFDTPGSYEITCGPHPFMKMIVEVR